MFESVEPTYPLLLGSLIVTSNKCNTGSFSINKFSVELYNLIRVNGWTKHVNFPMRCRQGQRPMCLDLVIINGTHQVYKIDYISPFRLSDHSFLNFDFVCHWTPLTKTLFSCKWFKMANFVVITEYQRDKINQFDTYSTDFTIWLSETFTLVDSLFCPGVNS